MKSWPHVRLSDHSPRLDVRCAVARTTERRMLLFLRRTRTDGGDRCAREFVCGSIPVDIFFESVFRACGNEIEKQLKKSGRWGVLSRPKVFAPGMKILRLLAGSPPEHDPVQFPCFVVPAILFGFGDVFPRFCLPFWRQSPASRAKPVTLHDDVHREQTEAAISAARRHG